ncbi:TPA: hypothetical protein JG870_004579, partial [Enterobacter hormaechei subsp. steigerwaltii]|nr:hypothetical protein [Enterobacter hormaechei subsp. steigerwaltii]
MIKLTRKESEILNLIIKKQSSAKICQQLKIKDKTLHSHKRNMISKIGVKGSYGFHLLSLLNSR